MASSSARDFVPARERRSSGVFDSVPPRPGPGPRKCEPIDDRKEATKHDGEWFKAWCADRHISQRDLSLILGVGHFVAQKKLNGRAPITTVDIGRFPPRMRDALMYAFGAHCASRDTLAHR
jgi:hypothetical protein